MLVTRIIDTGVGMTSEKIKSLFLVFDQVQKVRRESSLTNLILSNQTSENQYNFQGVGLGLYLSKTLANFLKGDIKVTSEIGLGTTVEVELPIQIG